MTPAQIKAKQDLCRPHTFSYEEMKTKGAFATCMKGCGFEWGQSDDYKALQRENRTGEKR